mmetsp:Transcript_60170/g.99356  ORF Transcript_60170/g.99356 Transcript_60170/m.99356 type:complete len:272 (-) Transcript_60170:310-1125(-)
MRSSLSIWAFAMAMQQASSQCPWVKISEPDEAAPYPIGMCIYNTPYYSTSLVCEENFNNTGVLKVVEYEYEGRDCIAARRTGIREVWDCDLGTDCFCEGAVEECKLLRTREYIAYTDPDHYGCNQSYYEEFVYVWDICRELDIGGSVYYDCAGTGEDTGGAVLSSYIESGCTGERTVSYPDGVDLCVLTTCTGDEIVLESGEGNGNNAGVVVAVIIIIVLLIVCGGLGYWYWSHKRKQGDYGFQDDAGTDGTGVYRDTTQLNTQGAGDDEL